MAAVYLDFKFRFTRSKSRKTEILPFFLKSFLQNGLTTDHLVFEQLFKLFCNQFHHSSKIRLATSGEDLHWLTRHTDLQNIQAVYC